MAQAHPMLLPVAKLFLPKPPDLIIGKEINRGAYGTVYEGKLNGQPVAVKKIHNALLEGGEGEGNIEGMLEGFHRECVLLEKADHRNVVKFYGAYYDQATGEPILVMERMKENLRDYLKRRRGQISSQKAIEICLSIARALHYLHSLPQPIVHRDLNDKNVMISEDGTVKIGDLGQSRLKEHNAMYFHSQAPGAVTFMPPETLRKGARYNEKIDTFSAGVLMLQVATQHSPDVMPVNIGAVKEIVRRETDLSRLPEDHPLKPIVVQCLEDDPKKRLSTTRLYLYLNRLDGSSPVAVSPESLTDSNRSPPYSTSPHGQQSLVTPVAKLDLSPHSIRQQNIKFSARLLQSCQLIKVGPPSVYKLKTEHLKVYEKHNIAACKIGDGNPAIDSLNKVLMIVGSVGCGKSTLINALANYILGVTFQDEYRFQLIRPEEEEGQSQAHSQTSWVKAYTFPRQHGSPVPYSLTIIDTPGYGDIRGMERDESVTQQIKHFFQSKEIGVDHLNAIAFVVRANDARLTVAQKHIFKSILAIFGNNVKPCIMIVATCADQKEIPALDALRNADVPINQHLVFAVNNVALYAQNVEVGNDEDSYVLRNKLTWKQNAKVFTTMDKTLGQMEDISLWQTSENLKERDNLRATLESIGPQIQEGAMNANNIRKMRAMIKSRKEEMDRNKDFDIATTLTVAKVETVVLPEYQFAFNCRKCETTCHYPCTTIFNRACEVISFRKNKCTVCKNECKAKEHRTDNFRYVTNYVTEKQHLTEEQLEKRFNYRLAEEGKSRSEAALEALVDNQRVILVKNMTLIRRAKQCLDRIQQISLNPSPVTETEFIDMMIENEKNEHKEGWEERIKSLEQLNETTAVIGAIQELNEDTGVAVLKKLNLDCDLL